MSTSTVPDEQEMRDSTAPTPETVEELASYVASLVDRQHDYGTCVYAMSLAAVAAYNLVAHKLGVTGFQASVADLDIIQRNRRMKGPFMLVDGSNVVYPQYDLVRDVTEAVEEWMARCLAKLGLEDSVTRKGGYQGSAGPVPKRVDGPAAGFNPPVVGTGQETDDTGPGRTCSWCKGTGEKLGVCGWCDGTGIQKPSFLGHGGPNEHRTCGPIRGRCYECREWCDASEPCSCCAASLPSSDTGPDHDVKSPDGNAARASAEPAVPSGDRSATGPSAADRIVALEALAKACEPLIACVHEIAANGSKVDKKLAVEALKAHIAAWDSAVCSVHAAGHQYSLNDARCECGAVAEGFLAEVAKLASDTSNVAGGEK